jgi:hypothetical protein
MSLCMGFLIFKVIVGEFVKYIKDIVSALKDKMNF